jgi:hypothetical protein
MRITAPMISRKLADWLEALPIWSEQQRVSSSRGHRGLILECTYIRCRILMNNATLPAEDAFLCRAVLSQDLMKVSKLLASGKDADGEELTRDNRLELMGYSSRLQLTMISLGLDSVEIGRIVKDFSTPKWLQTRAILASIFSISPRG